MTKPRAYIAGPLFDEGERWFIEKVDALVAEAGFETFLPHRDNPPKVKDNVKEIFQNDKRGIDICDVVVANLNGMTTDDGTALRTWVCLREWQIPNWDSYRLASSIRTRSCEPDD